MTTATVQKSPYVILYINGINTTKEEAKRQIQSIKNSIPSIETRCLFQNIYNPTQTDSYFDKEKFSSDLVVDTLIGSLTKAQHIFLITHSNGSTQMAKVLTSMNLIFGKKHPARKKISILNFGPDTPISNQLAQVNEVKNFCFKKDRISFIGQSFQSNNSHTLQPGIIWLNNPKKIPKKKIHSKHLLNKLVRNFNFVIENSICRHSFDSYLPHITRELKNKIGVL